MSKLALFILVLVSSKLVFVASQACTESKDCKENGSCCHDGFCTTECDDSCYENSQCDGGCCKDNKCQDTYGTCSRTDYYTTAAPDLSNSCHYDCSDYGECCVEGECRSCYQSTTLPSRGYPFDNVNYDEYHDSSDSSGKSYPGAGPIIGITLAAIILGIIVRCMMRVHCCPRERVVDVHRRIACARAPLLEDDELQREHERAKRKIPARLPPAYSQRPFQDNTENPSVNTNNVNGVQQGRRMVPPPAVPLWRVANQYQSTNSAQTYQNQGMTSNAEQMNGVPQGSLRVPPSTYPASPATNTSQNATEQNTQGNTMGPTLI